jgi:bifunctional non-homologous end joining protein LigD
MKALGVSEVGGDDWLLEIKYDGFRALGIVQGKTAELWSRNEKPLTSTFPEVAAALAKLKCDDAIVDGEVVALDEAGRPRFQLLQGLDMGKSRPPIHYFIFDLVHLNGESLLNLPIEERRSRLERLMKGVPDVLRLSPVFDVAPAELLERAREQGLEGIIGKKRGSLYEPGRRSGAWVKRRISFDQEFVIGGYTPPQGGRTHFGALVVGIMRTVVFTTLAKWARVLTQNS